jgi:hypothetical protein
VEHEEEDDASRREVVVVVVVEVVELLTTTCTVVFKVDGEILRDATTGQPIRHQLPYSGATAMQVFVGQKNGSASNELTSIDYIGVVQAK